jgi:hypothetical protein
MDRKVQIVGWVGVAIAGLVLWSAFPEVRTFLACFLAASLIYYVFTASVRLTTKRLVGDQLKELHLEINAITQRVEHLDRKTNAILMNALAQQQAANLRDVVRSVSKRAHAVH